jgi:Cu/Zn superoxide dismutase
MENTKNEASNSKSSNRLILQEIFIALFVLISILLGISLYTYSRSASFYMDELYLMRDIHFLKAYLKNYERSQLKGYIEISESFGGINVIGKIEGLRRGTSHGVHILEYSDISGLNRELSDDMLKHFNPTNLKHSCPSTNENDSMHFGDLGNVIANQEGVAFISISKKVPIKSLNGRIIVVTEGEDKCSPDSDNENAKNVLGFGLLNVFKPIVVEDINHSNEYFLREINSVNKKEFEVKNILFTPKNVEKKVEVKAKQEEKPVVTKTLNELHNNKIENHIDKNHPLNKKNDFYLKNQENNEIKPNVINLPFLGRSLPFFSNKQEYHNNMDQDINNFPYEMSEKNGRQHKDENIQTKPSLKTKKDNTNILEPFTKSHNFFDENNSIFSNDDVDTSVHESFSPPVSFTQTKPPRKRKQIFDFMNV